MKFTKAEEKAAALRNHITYAKVLVEKLLKEKRRPIEKELKLALSGLKKAIKLLRHDKTNRNL